MPTLPSPPPSARIKETIATLRAMPPAMRETTLKDMAQRAGLPPAA